MEKQEITSPIAKYLELQTGYFKALFDKLPSFQHYKLYMGDSDQHSNIYELIDYICDHRPVAGTRIELDYGTVYFSTPDLKWKVTTEHAGTAKATDLDKIASELDEITKNSTLIRNWEKRKSLHG